MKKGLSKILSLACVFALLLTMALPAMAAGNKPDLADAILAKGWIELDVKYATADETTAATTGVGGVTFNKLLVEGRFVKINDTTVKFLLLETEKQEGSVKAKFEKAGSDVAATDFTVVYRKNTDAETYLVDKSSNDVTGKVVIYPAASKANGETYFFDDYGYLQTGDDKGVYEYYDEDEGKTVKYLIGVKSDGTLYDRTGKTTATEAVTAATGVANYHAVAGSADDVQLVGSVVWKANADGLFELKAGEFEVTSNKFVYQGKDADGNIVPMAGAQKVSAAEPDAYGNKGEDTWKLYSFENATGFAVLKIASNAGDVVEAFTTYDPKATDASKKAGGAKKFIASDNAGGVRVLGDANEDGTANYPIYTKAPGTRYALNEDASIVVNTTKAEIVGAPKAVNNTIGSDNIVKYKGTKYDIYQDVLLTIDGVEQKYCVVPTTNILLVNGWRRLINENGEDLGVAWYTNDGLTYRGWIEGMGKSLKYQTVQDDVYYIVTGLQTLPAGVDPTDSEKAIDAGWYLFDNEGTLITKTKIEVNGKKYEIDADTHMVTSVDGHAPTVEDTDWYVAE